MVSRCLAGADDQNVMTRFREELRFPFDSPRHRSHLLAKRRMVARLGNRRQARDLLTRLAAAKVSSRSATFSSRAAVCSMGSRAVDFARPW
jgi:hypothetical protein